MSQILVDKNICKKDGTCVAVCPVQAIAMSAEGYPEETGAPCIFCGHCVAICGSQALTHTGLPVEEMLPAAKEQPSAQVIDNMLMSQRSIREFSDKPVEKETLAAILDVARRAPTACNAQNLHWIVLNGRERVHELAGECVRQLKMMPPSAFSPIIDRMVIEWEAGTDRILRSATAVVAVCAPQQSPLGREDASIALTYAELAAAGRGVGMTWAGLLMFAAAASEPLRQWLKVPEGCTVATAAMFGYGKYKYKWIPPRKPLSAQWL